MSRLETTLNRFLNSVNKYDIQEYAGQLRTLATRHNAWDIIAPYIIDAIKTSRNHIIRTSAMFMLCYAGEAARPILPYLIEINSYQHDSNLASNAARLIEAIARTYKDEPDTVQEILASLQDMVDERMYAFSGKTPLLYELAQLLEAVPNFPVSRDDVLKEVNLDYRAIDSTLAKKIRKNGQGVLPERAFEIIDNLEQLNQLRYAAKSLQHTIKPIEFHSETGWQDNEQIYRVLDEFRASHALVKSMYIFGSRAGTGTYRLDSDLDIAVILDLENDKSGRDEWFTYRSEWKAWLSERLPYEIDLNWYIDEDATPEIHRAISSGPYRAIGVITHY